MIQLNKLSGKVHTFCWTMFSLDIFIAVGSAVGSNRLNTEYPCIGGSLDGIVTCSCHKIRGIEIKCPYNYQKGLINWDEDRTFPIDRSNSIKKNHPYYYQMQLQMSVCKLSKIDFFIFSPANGGSSSLYVQVPIDNQFLQCEIFPKVLLYF